MTDTMLFGVLKKPFEMAMKDEISRIQFYARVQKLVGRFEAQQQAEPDRRDLQAAGTHPAPCARHCEAKAFEIEIRSLKSALKQQQAEPVSQRSDGMPTSKTERDLRRMLCIARHGGAAYMDDGEASFCGDKYYRSIDYMRESIETIRQAWYDAGIKKLSGAQPEQQAEPDRRPLQAEGKHPAPCARHCEAKAFEIEIRSLKSALETQAASKEDMKVYRSIVDNYWKGLAAKAEQQAEPVAWNKGVLPMYPTQKDGETFAVSYYADLPQQQAEPVGQLQECLYGRGQVLWFEKPADLSMLYTAPPQRKELSASEILDMMPSQIPSEYDGPLMEFARAVEAKLKERNK